MEEDDQKEDITHLSPTGRVMGHRILGQVIGCGQEQMDIAKGAEVEEQGERGQTTVKM